RAISCASAPCEGLLIAAWWSAAVVCRWPCQISRAQRRGEALDRVAQHSTRHARSIPSQESLLGGAVALPHLAQHPADRFVNQIVTVVDEDGGDAQRVVE